MSYALDMRAVSDQITNKICSMLYFLPRSTYSKFKRKEETNIAPIEFYVKDGNILHIPYLFASAFFNFIPNDSINYPKQDLNFKGNLRDNQIPVEAECWELLQRRGTAILGLYPGFGKTILGAKASCRIKLVTVVLVNREILTVQWKKTYEDFTDAKVWIVGDKIIPPLFNVIICMNTRWNKIPEEIRNLVGFLIIDEAHSFCTPSNVQCLLLAFHPKFVLIESAYLMRDDEMECMIYAIAGEKGVYRESNKPFKVMKICTGTKPQRKQTYRGVDWPALVKAIAFNERRNNIILSLIASNLKYKILALTLLRDHSDLLYNSLQQMNISSDYLCGGKKGYQDSNVLVGTMSKIGTGFDPATFCPTYAGVPFEVLIICSSIKKCSAYVQNVGRIFRCDFPVVMHLVDSDDIFVNHWNKGRKWYIARGGIISEHHIPGGDVNTLSTNINVRQRNWAESKAEELRLERHAKIDAPVVLK